MWQTELCFHNHHNITACRHTRTFNTRMNESLAHIQNPGMHTRRFSPASHFALTHSAAFRLTHSTHSGLLQLDWIRGLLFSAKLLSHLSLSPADPAPPLFLWGTSLPEAHPGAPPCPPISQQQHPSLLSFNKPRALSIKSSARDSAPMTSRAAGVL